MEAHQWHHASSWQAPPLQAPNGLATRAIASLSDNHPSFTRTNMRARTAHTHAHTHRELEDVGLKLRDTLTSNLPKKQTATPREQGGGQAGAKEGGVWRRF